MKKALIFLLSFVLIVLLAVLIPVATTFYTVNRAAFITHNANLRELYEKGIELAFEESKNEFISQVEQSIAEETGTTEVVLSQELESQIDTVISPLFDVFVPESRVDDVTTNNVQNVFSYLNGEGDALLIYVPAQETLEDVKEKLPGTVNSILKVVKNYKTCSESELQALANTGGGRINVDCIPVEVKTFIEEDNRLTDVLDNIDIILDEVTEDEALLQKNEFTLAELAEITAENEDSPDQTEIMETEELLEQGRNAISITKTILIASIVVWLVLLLLTVLLPKTRKGKVRTAGGVLLSGSIGWSIIAMVTKLSLISMVTDELVLQLENDSELDPELQKWLAEFLTNLLDDVVANILFVAAVFTILGLTLLIISMVLKSKHTEQPDKLVALEGK